MRKWRWKERAWNKLRLMRIYQTRGCCQAGVTGAKAGPTRAAKAPEAEEQGAKEEAVALRFDAQEHKKCRGCRGPC
jgi:hypothetical protein